MVQLPHTGTKHMDTQTNIDARETQCEQRELDQYELFVLIRELNKNPNLRVVITKNAQPLPLRTRVDAASNDTWLFI